MRMEEQRKRMPLLPLRGLTVLPGMVLHFDISRERSIKAVETAMSTDQNIFLVTQKNPDHNNPGLRDLYEIGLEAKIRNVAKLPQGIIRVMVEGGERGRLLELDDGGPYLVERPRKSSGSRWSCRRRPGRPCCGLFRSF